MINDVGKGGTHKIGFLVIHPSTGYKNAINHFDNHSKLAYHRECSAKSEAFKRAFENLGLDIRDQIIQERIKMKKKEPEESSADH